MVSNNLIRDNRLSPECRWLLIYLLTHAEGWVIKLGQIKSMLSEHKGYGRDSLRKIVNEACAFGYMKIEKYLQGNMTRIRYLVSESGSFCKKDYEDSNNPSEALNLRAPEIRALKKDSYISPSNESISISKKGSTSTPPSADAESLYTFFLNSLRERNPGFKEPNRERWVRDFDRLLRLDKRDLDEIRKVIEWAAQEDWYKCNCLSPDNLRRNFDKMTMQMAANSEKITSQVNRSFAMKQKLNFPDMLKALSFDSKFARNLLIGKEIPFTLPVEQFRAVFAEMFGGVYVRNSVEQTAQ